MRVTVSLAGAPFMILAGNPDPQPSALSSISVRTDDQAETDRLWALLTADGGEGGRCGWLTARFGAPWQIAPEALQRLLSGGAADACDRAMAALMEMRKIDIAALEAASAGTSVS